MPAPGTRVTLATLLGAADALVIESVEGDVVVLSDGCGLHEGAKASTRIYDGERVWHLTFCVRERHELAPGPRASRSRSTSARCSARSAGCRASPAGSPRPRAAPATPPPRPGRSVLDVSQGGLALRTGSPTAPATSSTSTSTTARAPSSAHASRSST